MLHNKYLKIMDEFLKGYNKKIYGRELIGKVNLSQKNIALTLDELEQKGILKSLKNGNRRYYELNFLNPLLGEKLLSFEILKRIDFLEKHQKLIDFFNKLDAEVICVFGSYAKGQEKENSDLDLFVVGNLDSLKIQKLGNEFGIDVQLFNFSSKDFFKAIKNNNEIFREMMGNHVLVKGGELFVKEILNG